jgi:hypothetical protein
MMNEITSCVLACLLFLGASLAIARNTQFNMGMALEFGEPASSILGIYYDTAPEDSITIQNQKFLCEVIKDGDYIHFTADFIVGPRYKLVPFDSVFVSVYIPNWYSSGHALMVLNDIKTGQHYYLNSFLLSDYNNFIYSQRIQNLNDFIKLANTFIILSNIRSNIYFIESFNDFIYAERRETPFCLDPYYKNLERLFADRVNKATVDTLGDSIRVSLFVEYLSEWDIEKFILNFQGPKITKIDSTLAIDGKEISKIIGP